MTKENTFNALILIALISFSFFGSLSHVFLLVLIILMFIEYKKPDNQNTKDLNNLLLFFIVSTCFFLFLFTSFFHSNLGESLTSLSPMLPIPIIGMLIIFHKGIDFKLTSKKLSQFSQISILFLSVIICFSTYLISFLAYPFCLFSLSIKR